MAITNYAETMQKKIRLKDANGNILHPETLAELVKTDNAHLFVTNEEKGIWNAKFTVKKIIELPEFEVAENNVLYVLGSSIYFKGESTLELIGGEPTTITEKDIASGEAHNVVLATIGNPKNGDIAILKELINGKHKQYTAYVYTGTAWVAMDGNYNAENVYFDKDLITTVTVGNISVSGGQATIPAAGKNLKQVFDTIFVKEKNPSITQPSVSLTFSQAKAYEVGTSVTPSFSATLNAGSYQYGPATGVTATSWSVTDSASNTPVAESTGSFPAFIVGDSTNYTITATAQHTAGSVPVTNVGNAYTGGKIVAGSKSTTSDAVTGYRSFFYGAKADRVELNSETIRGLTNGQAFKTSFTISFQDGVKQVIIALPGSHTLTKVEDTGAFGTDIVANFVKTVVSVEGKDRYSPTNYNVYEYKPDSALGKNTYKITCE